MISQSTIWHSPLNALHHCVKVDINSTDKKNRHKLEEKIEETQTVVALCLALYRLHGVPYYLQLAKKDPPDAYIARLPNEHGTLEVGTVEITTYFRRDGKLPKKTLLDQLKLTKTFEGYHKYGEHDVVLVHIGIGIEIDSEEIWQYLTRIKAPYQLWLIQEVSNHPDTIAELTMCYPHRDKQRINIGKVAYEQKSKGISSGTLVARLVGELENVGIEPSPEKIDEAPWETAGK